MGVPGLHAGRFHGQGFRVVMAADAGDHGHPGGLLQVVMALGAPDASQAVKVAARDPGGQGAGVAGAGAMAGDAAVIGHVRRRNVAGRKDLFVPVAAGAIPGLGGRLPRQR